MARTLFVVPKMYTHEQIRLLTKDLPPDFDEKYNEFWNYVKERTIMLTGKIHGIYFDSLYESGEKGLKNIMLEDKDAGKIVESLMQSGATLYSTEDKILVEETKSWLDMMGMIDDETIIDMIQKNMKERDEYIYNMIGSTLKEDEMGIIFISPERKINLSEDMRIIRICRFEPSDYLKSYLVQIGIKDEKTD